MCAYHKGWTHVRLALDMTGWISAQAYRRTDDELALGPLGASRMRARAEDVRAEPVHHERQWRILPGMASVLFSRLAATADPVPPGSLFEAVRARRQARQTRQDQPGPRSGHARSGSGVLMH